MTTITNRVPSGATGGSTKRVTGEITASTTVRVPDVIVPVGPYLLLQGDSSGALSLQDPDTEGFMKLQGIF